MIVLKRFMFYRDAPRDTVGGRKEKKKPKSVGMGVSLLQLKACAWFKICTLYNIARKTKSVPDLIHAWEERG